MKKEIIVYAKRTTTLFEMIKKIKTIRNLAVFRDFDWDTNVRERKNNNVIEFRKLNVIYGRNYSGKTTLSRLIRALETGRLSDKYENPECTICIDDNADINQTNFTAHNKTVRVFNEDFISDNLKFIIDPNENVVPFAILGEGNNEIETEITELKKILGSSEADKETGLYQELKSIKAVYKLAKKSHDDAKASLNNQLSGKATGNPNGIKYQSRFGEVNYNINKLKTDIESVLKSTYEPLSEERRIQEENVLKEETKSEIPPLVGIDLKFEEFHINSSEIVTREIGQSNKIQELIQDAILNRWVKEGRQLHQGKTDVCSFCNNKIENTRWDELDKHFDEESDKLEKDIDDLIAKMNLERDRLLNYPKLKVEQFYSKFHTNFTDTKKSFDDAIESYMNSLLSIENQLMNRKENVLIKQNFETVVDFSMNIENSRIELEKLRIASNEYSEKLISDQNKAKINLRLNEVYEFVNNIKYNDLTSALKVLGGNEKTEKSKVENKQNEIDEILEKITSKQRELKDESKGADKVNEFLNDHFGHDFLTLKAVELKDDLTGNKIYRFEIHREGKKAYHLSEGEKSLIAFCYFVAKLEDIDTKGKSPIIWIDDPISSLDGNHIFFIYSLLKTKIYDGNNFEQIFVSTHNLNFFKYLQRLPSHNDKKNDGVRQFIIERKDKTSIISEMPDYIRRNVTEFNHLFKQIMECSKLDNVNDDNYTLFYNFGNNARKFFEIYLFYKYPDASDDIQKLKKFFGEEEIPVILTDRINNEYSHLSGIFERGQQPVEVPEMKKAADLIIQKLQEKDKDQFDALVNSIS